MLWFIIGAVGLIAGRSTACSITATTRCRWAHVAARRARQPPRWLSRLCAVRRGHRRRRRAGVRHHRLGHRCGHPAADLPRREPPSRPRNAASGYSLSRWRSRPTASRSVSGWTNTNRPRATAPGRRRDEGELIDERLFGPGVPVGRAPTPAARTARPTAAAPSPAAPGRRAGDHRTGPSGEVDPRPHGGDHGVCAVDDEGEPERQAAGAPCEMEGEVRRVDVFVTERLEVPRRLPMDRDGERRPAVQEGGAVER